MAGLSMTTVQRAYASAQDAFVSIKENLPMISLDRKIRSSPNFGQENLSTEEQDKLCLVPHLAEQDIKKCYNETPFEFQRCVKRIVEQQCKPDSHSASTYTNRDLCELVCDIIRSNVNYAPLLTGKNKFDECSRPFIACTQNYLSFRLNHDNLRGEYNGPKCKKEATIKRYPNTNLFLVVVTKKLLTENEKDCDYCVTCKTKATDYGYPTARDRNDLPFKRYRADPEYPRKILLPTKSSNDSISEIVSPKQHTPHKDRGMLTTLFNFSLRSPSTLSNKSSCRRTSSVRTPIDQTPRVINEDSQISTIEKALRIIESRKRSSHSVEEITPQKPSKKIRNETFIAANTSHSKSFCTFPEESNQSCSVKAIPKKVIRKRASYVPSHILEAHVFGEQTTIEPDLSKVDLSIQESAYQPELSASNDDVSPQDSINSNNSEIENRAPLAPITRVDTVSQFVSNLEARTQSSFKRGVLKRGLRSVVRSQTQPVGSDFESRVDKIRKLLSNVFEHSPDAVQNQVTLISSTPTTATFTTPKSVNITPVLPIITTSSSVPPVSFVNVSKPEISASPLATVSTDSLKSTSTTIAPPLPASVGATKLSFGTASTTVAQSLHSGAISSAFDVAAKPTFSFVTPKTSTETSTPASLTFNGAKTTTPTTSSSVSFSFGASANSKVTESVAPPTTAISFATLTTSSVTPSFSFGDKSIVKSHSVVSSTQSKTAPVATFNFSATPETCAATSSESKSLFSFGSTTAKPVATASSIEPSFGSSTPAATSGDSKPDLPKHAFTFAASFGSGGTTTATTSSEPPVKPTFSFAAVSTTSDTVTKTPFAFGTPATTSDTSTKPSFSFATKTTESATSQPSIFGSNTPKLNEVPKASFSFGTSVMPTTTKATFNFGGLVTKAAENLTVTTTNASSISKPTFAFGASATTVPNAPKPSLNFGTVTTTASSSLAMKPAFSFGAPVNSDKVLSTLKPSFSFGASASTLPQTSDSTSSLGFGLPKHQEPAKAIFDFGSSTKTTTSSNGLFNFNLKPTTENPTAINFKAVQASTSETPKALPFSFVAAVTEGPKLANNSTFASSSTSTAAPATLFSFGSDKTASTSSSMFSFGTNQTAIAQNSSECRNFILNRACIFFLASS
ncbi:hypothetical protein Ciccas_011542 [Cichlidogyrus casuarinus]|uniref:Uncharacterized protein n=1 Tax=Cichlidogyrus casuarinus TaxID=1844966 RepID=A0ABD2PS91_9PLAT